MTLPRQVVVEEAMHMKGTMIDTGFPSHVRFVRPL